jgi:tripartite-type tricarboxylate transporter receptor subunit TctC
MKFSRSMLRAFLAGVMLLIVSPVGAAEAYPNRPIRLVVAFPPGGTTDVFGRMVAARMAEALGQSIVIENKAGASGLLGTKAVVGSPADGYTVLFTSSLLSTLASLYPSIGFDPEVDLEPIGIVATSPYLMVVHPSFPVNSIAELISHAKAHPGTISYAGSGPGSAQHLGWELFKRATDTNMTYIPYKGTGELMSDLLAGRLQAAIDNVAVLTEHVRSGRLRAIAVTSATRSSLLPEVPTVAEGGLANFQSIGWFGVYVPAKTPAPVVKALGDALQQAMARKDVRDELLRRGADPKSGSADEMRRLLSSEIKVWSKVIREANIKVE